MTQTIVTQNFGQFLTCAINQPLGSEPLLDSHNFLAWEDFSRRDCRSPIDMMKLFACGSARFQTYVNGFAEARQCYLALVSRKVRAVDFDETLRGALQLFPERLRLPHLDATHPLTEQVPDLQELLVEIQENPAESDEDILHFMRSCLQAIGSLFQSKVPPIVGGEVQLEIIKPPGSVVACAADCPIYHE